MGASLYYLPEPYADELPLSWMLRSAAFHGVSLGQLLTSVNIKGRADCDVDISGPAISRLLSRVDIPADGVRRIFTMFAPCRGVSWVRRWLRTDQKGSLITSYCPACLSDGVEPYWRAVWRFKFWVVCPAHRQPMLGACHACNATVELKRYEARVTSERKVPLLARCLRCGSSLSSPNVGEAECGQVQTHDLLGLQMSVASALAHNGFKVRGLKHQLPLSFLPGLLLQGVQVDDGSERPIDPRASALLRSSLSMYWLSGQEGLYTSRRVYREQAGLVPLFLGDPKRYADLAITKRFVAL